ncbi:hypothetical protein FACS18949_05180 [Clostridia bacterium]|nr:hypothetical protein FACS18949_05180 [Clostridia bacterium]
MTHKGTVTLETATLNDCQILADMNKQLIDDEGDINPMTVADLEARMSAWLLNGTYAAYLFKRNDTTVGYALVDPKETPPWVRHFFICREHRRQRYGRAAVKLLLEKLDVDEVGLSCWSYNARGLAFWRSFNHEMYSVKFRIRKPNDIETPIERWDVYAADKIATGRSRARNEVFGEDEYHLGAAVWIMNPSGQVLVARRALHRQWNPGKWEIPGGHVLSGEDSLTAAIREVSEEVGISVSGENAVLIGTYPMMPDRMLCDVWLFRENFNIADANFQESETMDAKTVTLSQVREMLTLGEFIAYPGIYDELEKLERYLNNSSVTIIPYEEKYRDDMIFCFLSAKDALSKLPNGRPLTFKTELLDVPGVYLSRGDVFYLAIDETDRVVGMIGTETVSPTELWLKRLFVKPEAKGNGIGSKLLAEVEQFAVLKGITAIHTRFADWYTEAARFYPARGFTDADSDGSLRHMVKRYKDFDAEV